jgi:hypothetical protein
MQEAEARMELPPTGASCPPESPSTSITLTAGAPQSGYRGEALRSGAGVSSAPLGWSLESKSALSSIGLPGPGTPDPSGLRSPVVISPLAAPHTTRFGQRGWPIGPSQSPFSAPQV